MLEPVIKLAKENAEYENDLLLIRVQLLNIKRGKNEASKFLPLCKSYEGQTIQKLINELINGSKPA